MAEKEKSDNLYTDDNPETTIHGLGFKDESTAKKSISKLKSLVENEEISQNHALQAAISMEQRSKHHPNRSEDMEAAEKLYRTYIEQLKKS